MAIWQRNRSQVIERLDFLDRAACTTPLSEGLRMEAAAIAHKLAGSLGMFGFPEGTRLARILEELLEQSDPDQALLVNLSTELRQTLFPTDA
jgi:HPt (histidine-containing phosphotransfer) domain-containing protein